MPENSGDLQSNLRPPQKGVVVEHLDPELEEWSTLEYTAIADECQRAGILFFLTSIPTNLKLPDQLQKHKAIRVKKENAEDIFAATKDRVCLLDPSADEELRSEDGDKFDIFLFGGILGDDPPRDRTSILRKRGFAGRSLGSMQMTTDTAARVTMMIVAKNMSLASISFVDKPIIKVNEHESAEMPFRYVKGNDGQPIMPPGMVELIKKDSDRHIGDVVEIL